jgi:hypothetical protein
MRTSIVAVTALAGSLLVAPIFHPWELARRPLKGSAPERVFNIET